MPKLFILRSVRRGNALYALRLMDANELICPVRATKTHLSLLQPIDIPSETLPIVPRNALLPVVREPRSLERDVYPIYWSSHRPTHACQTAARSTNAILRIWQKHPSPLRFQI